MAIRRLLWRPLFYYHMAMFALLSWRLRNVPTPLTIHATPAQMVVVNRMFTHLLRAGSLLLPSPASGGGK